MTYYNVYKPKKIVYVPGTGNNYELNMNPYKSKDIEYRYAGNEHNAPNAQAELARQRIDAYRTRMAGQATLNNLFRAKQHANTMANKSSIFVPILRAFGFKSQTTHSPCYMASNPVLHYDRTLIMTSLVWSALPNKPAIYARDNSNVEQAVGIEHSLEPIFEVASDKQEQLLGSVYSMYVQWENLFSLTEDIASVVGELWEKIPDSQRVAFSREFLSQLHHDYNEMVVTGQASNLVEDTFIAYNPKLSSIGYFACQCYKLMYDTDTELHYAYPRIDEMGAESILETFHTIDMPARIRENCSNSLQYMTDSALTGYYSELYEYLKTMPTTEIKEKTVGDIVDELLLMQNVIKKFGIFIHALNVGFEQLNSDVKYSFITSVKNSVASYELDKCLNSNLDISNEYRNFLTQIRW